MLRPSTPHFALVLWASFSLGLGFLEGQEITIPEDLLHDDHVREEFGVNPFTAPSIERIFKTLDALGELPYDELSRKLPENPPRERSIAALSLGTLIADGLLTVQCEQRGDLKPIGEALKAHAEALGTDKRMTRHTKSLVELSLSGDWEKLKAELAATQSDVEEELVLLRDVKMPILISLGGWLRAFQVASKTLSNQFDAEKAKVILRLDILDYYLAEMETLKPDLLSQKKVDVLQADLEELRTKMDPATEDLYTKEHFATLSKKTEAIMERLFKRPAAG